MKYMYKTLVSAFAAAAKRIKQKIASNLYEAGVLAVAAAWTLGYEQLYNLMES